MNEHDSYEGMISNFNLLYAFRDELRKALGHMEKPTILDYGAGRDAGFTLLFLSIHRNATITIFDPNIEKEKLALDFEVKLDVDAPRVHIETQEPEGNFDLVIFSFSLHHMGENLNEKISRAVQRFKPRYIGIMDYDYTDSDQGEFLDTFSSGPEQTEVRTTFGGDWEKARKFHARLGMEKYRKALESNAFLVVSEGKGEGIARSKFLLIEQGS